MMSDQITNATDADELTVDRGSGNVFADLGVADANAMQLKSGLAIRLGDLIKRQ